MLSPIRKGWLSLAAYSGMFVFGIVMALLGAVLPVLSERLHFSLARAGDLFLAMSFGMLASTLAAGPTMDRFGKKLVLVSGAVSASAALLLIGTASTYGRLGFAILLLGAAGGALNAGTNTLVADLHTDAREKSSALNILGIFFGFGALFQPFFIGSLLESLGFHGILSVTAGLSFIPLVLYLALSFPPPVRGSGLRLREAAHLARNPLVLVLGFLLFFQSGNEFVLGGYTSTYLTRELNSPVRVASYLLALYWGALMAGRIISSRLVLRIKGSTLVLASAILSSCGMGLVLAASSVWVAAAGIAVVGLGFASVYPVTLGLAGDRFRDHSGTVFGILFAIALTGGMIMPWTVGQIASAISLHRAMFLPIGCAAAIFALQVVAARIDRGNRNSVTGGCEKIAASGS